MVIGLEDLMSREEPESVHVEGLVIAVEANARSIHV